jgi:hypothetical protein
VIVGLVLPVMILSVIHAVVQTDVLTGIAIVVVVVVFSLLVLLLIEFVFEAAVDDSVAIDVVVVILHFEIVAVDIYFHQLVIC